jgi:cytosine/adenosine deaminase-related metal-dependent hydrolase
MIADFRLRIADLIITNGTLLPMASGSAPIQNGAIAISDGRIDAMGAASEIENTFDALVYSATGADVRDVIIDGKVIMENRKLLTLDEGEILERMGELRQEIAERIGHGR